MNNNRSIQQQEILLEVKHAIEEFIRLSDERMLASVIIPEQYSILSIVNNPAPKEILKVILGLEQMRFILDSLITSRLFIGKWSDGREEV